MSFVLIIPVFKIGLCMGLVYGMKKIKEVLTILIAKIPPKFRQW